MARFTYSKKLKRKWFFFRIELSFPDKVIRIKGDK